MGSGCGTVFWRNAGTSVGRHHRVFRVHQKSTDWELECRAVVLHYHVRGWSKFCRPKLERLCYRVATYFGEAALVLTVDASPWGLGGFLEYKFTPVGWFVDRVQSCDVSKFGIIIGSHQFQTLLEAFAVLVAVRCWTLMWMKYRVPLRVRRDSLSTPGAVSQLRSKTPGQAAIIRELALDCAEEAHSLQMLEHLPGVQNVWADALSRVWQPGQISNIPDELLKVPQCRSCPRTAAW